MNCKIASTIRMMLGWLMRNILSKNKTFKAMIRIKVKIKRLYNAK